MPLLKLWNSLLGRGSSAKTTVVPEVSAAPAAEAVGFSHQPLPKSASSRRNSARAAAAPTPSASTEPAKELRVAPATTIAPPPKPKPKVVTRGEHADLCRIVIETGARSVLEIGVGDGSRAAAVMQSLQAVSGEQPLKYAAIDTFEMGGGSLTLKDFHHRLRAVGVRPQVYPSTMDAGLFQFSRTVGFADVVISTAALDEWNSAETRALIARVTRPTSLVLHHCEGRWHRSSAAEFKTWVRSAA